MFRLAVFLVVFPVLINSRGNNGTCDICDCSVKRVVNCANRNLTYIPRDLNASTIVLNMSSNYIQVIEKGIFRKLTKLKILDLYDTSLKSENMSGDVFEGLSNLKVLNISQNDRLPLTNVSKPPEFFQHIPSLQVLSMYGTTGSYNKNDSYPDTQLCKLESLRELWTDGLTGVKFGQEFQNMPSLKTLRLAGDLIDPSWRSKEFCSTNLMDGMLDNLVSITHLYIRKCNVQSVDRNAFQKLENLEYLDLSKNKILDISQLFQSFCSLSNKTTHLILNSVMSTFGNNCGTTIKESMVQCLKNKSIRELQLNHNRLQYIGSKALYSLPKTLQVVSASRNEFYLGLYIFDVSFMTNLTELDVSYQFFTEGTSIWHKESEVEKGFLETSSGPADRKRNNSADVSETKGNQANRSVAHRRDNNDDEIAEERFQRGSKFQGFIDQLFTNISFKDTFHYNPHQGENNSDEPFCPQTKEDKYIPPGTIIANIPPNLKVLDLSHSKHASPIFPLFINESNTLRKLIASSSLLYCWEGPVHGLTRLESLDLSVNFCTKVSNNFFQKVSSLRFLNISYNFLSVCIKSDDQGQILSNLTALESLDISFNKILSIPKLFVKSQSKLKKLFAQANFLEDFNVDIRHMTQLQRLDLRMNKIGWLSESFCDDLERIASLTSRNTTRYLYVDLRNNSIQCSCRNLKFLKWVYEHFRRNTSLIVSISHCMFYENRSTISFESRESLGYMVAQLEGQCRSYTSLIAGLSVTFGLIINVILGVLVHRFRWKLQYWYYVVLDNRCTRKVRRGEYEPLDEPRYKYDVCVISPEDRKDFVIDKLRPVFRDMGLAAFIPVYHINFNERLVNIIGKAIHESKVIVFVLCEEWFSDHCMNIAVHMWQCDMVKRKKQTVLGIYLNNMRGEDAEKVNEIYCQTFIDYPGDKNQDEVTTFWRECERNIRDLGVEG